MRANRRVLELAAELPTVGRVAELAFDEPDRVDADQPIGDNPRRPSLVFHLGNHPEYKDGTTALTLNHDVLEALVLVPPELNREMDSLLYVLIHSAALPMVELEVTKPLLLQVTLFAGAQGLYRHRDRRSALGAPPIDLHGIHRLEYLLDPLASLRSIHAFPVP